MHIIKEFKEFTWDMIRGLPKAYYYHTKGEKVRVLCKPGLRELYYFADEVIEEGRFEPYNDSLSYNKEAPQYALNEWTPPPLKDHFGGKINFNKPVVVVQNKYALEWSQGVYNFFPLEVLDELFVHLKENYDIVYIRPTGKSKDYYNDENEIKEFKDYEFIKEKHPEVYTIEDLLNTYPNISYNTLQFMIEASSDKHITVSGGNACVAAYFGGDVVIFDSPHGAGAGRGIWKTDSWLKHLGGANIYGVNDYVTLVDKITKLWIS